MLVPPCANDGIPSTPTTFSKSSKRKALSADVSIRYDLAFMITDGKALVVEPSAIFHPDRLTALSLRL